MLSLLQFCILFLPHSGHAETIFEDFETGTFTNWQVSGDAFGNAPAQGNVGRQTGVRGYAGKGSANSFHADDNGQGKMVSRAFKITTKYISFLIGGGAHQGKTCMDLVVGGDSVRTAVGRKSNTFHQQLWDVAEFKDKEAHLEIIDSFSGGWGFIMVDHIVFSDDKKVEVPEAQPPAGKERPLFVSGIQVPEGFKIEVFADENQVTNPTAICLDENGSLYAAETHRFRIQGGADNRENVFWLIEACEQRKEAQVAEALKTYRAKEENLISAFLVSLSGGDRKTGELVFEKHGAAQCMQCHKVLGKGGDAGPELSGVGQKSREYLLRSLVEPAAELSPGFSTINLRLKDESVQTGLFLGEDDTHVFLHIGKEKEQISKENIEERSTPTSAMPSMAGILSKREMRDLIEFLSSLKAKQK
ncbi:MAG: c-type cytochrome [Planctomycetota bacterium]|nr:c-type cytochrome [Planctomycetota bacterium]